MGKHYDLILLFSGGFDSTLLLKIALRHGLVPYCVMFDYGQKHVVELEYAKKICKDNDVDWVVVYLAVPFQSNLMDVKKTYEGVNVHHVPSRNLMFVSIAAGIAESMEVPLIWYGANYEDREKLFPDCYQEWVYKVNELLSINGSMIVKVEAPLLGMSKELIKIQAEVLGIKNEQIFTGYGE
jgi:7-cyano-7-deazaguanine synthase